MRIFVKGLMVFGLLVSVSGCAPEEEAYCKHIMAIYEGDDDVPNELQDMQSCIEHQQDKKARRGVNSYRREAECVLATDTIYGVRKCIQREEKRHG